MFSYFWLFFWIGLTVLAFVAGLSLRARLRERLGSARGGLDDDDVRRIIETGHLRRDQDAPLDLEEIDDQEERFWSESSWDEPEEW